MNYIRRNKSGIEVSEDLGVMGFDTTLKKYINKKCITNLSTYEGRRDSISRLLGEKNNIPIYVDEGIFLYPTKSIRDYNTVFVNFNEVLSLNEVRKGYTSFIFTNLSEITVDVSINIIKKQHKRIKKILDYLDNMY